MDFEAYIEKARKPSHFQPTNKTKQCYLDICEQTLEAFEYRYLEKLTKAYKEGGIADIQSFGRVLCVLGALIANGRKASWKSLWERMMDLACTKAHTLIHNTQMDFAVKEIMLAYHAMEPFTTKEQHRRWLENLARLSPELNYTQRVCDECAHPANICVYNMAGEYLREFYGLCSTDEYYQQNWPQQLTRFDGNGMYIDPNAPMLYDLTTRCQIQIMLHFGYCGAYFKALDSNLQRAALYSLFLQSSCFEFPYGGRSNQFLFNEALLAANFEYEAVRYKQSGNMKMAGMLKRAAHLAIQSIQRWLSQKPAKHIKNMFRFDSAYGAEGYGYYDKYMITLGSFVYPAFLYADDSIEEFPCPAELGGYVLKTSESFHKVAANAHGYSVEIDTKADFHYDSTGLGRFHKYGAPTELALSVPLVKHPSYSISDIQNRTISDRTPIDSVLREKNPQNLCITPSIQIADKLPQRLCDFSDHLMCELQIHEQTPHAVSFELIYRSPDFDGFSVLTEHYQLDGDGLALTAEFDTNLPCTVSYEIPLLITNGKLHSQIKQPSAHEVSVVYEGMRYLVRSDSKIEIKPDEHRNRNGIYCSAIASATGDSISIHLEIVPDNH